MILERAMRSVLRAQARERLCKASSLPDKPKGYQPFGGTRLSALRTRTARAGTAAPPSRRLHKQASVGSEPSSPAYGPMNTACSTVDSSSSSTGDTPIPGCSALPPFSPHASAAHDSPQVFASRDVPRNGRPSKSCDSSPRSPPRSLTCQGFDVKMASKQCIVFDDTPKVAQRCEDFQSKSSISTGIERMAGCTIGHPRMERRAGRGDVWTGTSIFSSEAESESNRTCAEDERILRAMNDAVLELRWGDGYPGRARYDGQLRLEKLGPSIGLKRV
uniref:uncharacterized protein n=1 Tax=Myxine glutinosa TaxID=7769 RepID=UPI00358F6613